MMKEEWDALYLNSREEAWLLPDRKPGIAFDLIRALGQLVLDQAKRIDERERRNEDATSNSKRRWTRIGKSA